MVVEIVLSKSTHVSDSWLSYKHGAHQAVVVESLWLLLRRRYDPRGVSRAGVVLRPGAYWRQVIGMVFCVLMLC